MQAFDPKKLICNGGLSVAICASISEKNHITAALIVLGLSSCAHHRDVRVSESGVHSVILQTEFRDEGYDLAQSQAEHYCEQTGKGVVVVEERSKYVGGGQEDDYLRYKKIAKALEMTRAAGATKGEEKEHPIGSGAGTAGAVINSALGLGYQYTMKFKCKGSPQ
jgi:hypothetical protein